MTYTQAQNINAAKLATGKMQSKYIRWIKYQINQLRESMLELPYCSRAYNSAKNDIKVFKLTLDSLQ